MYHKAVIESIINFFFSLVMLLSVVVGIGIAMVIVKYLGMLMGFM